MMVCETQQMNSFSWDFGAAPRSKIPLKTGRKLWRKCSAGATANSRNLCKFNDIKFKRTPTKNHQQKDSTVTSQKHRWFSFSPGFSSLPTKKWKSFDFEATYIQQMFKNIEKICHLIKRIWFLTHRIHVWYTVYSPTFTIKINQM